MVEAFTLPWDTDLHKNRNHNFGFNYLAADMAVNNIIFDLGGVIYHIDYEAPIQAFKNLGIQNFNEQFSKATQSNLFENFEKGLVSPEEFRLTLNKQFGLNLSDDEIDTAWNSILIGIPESKIAELSFFSAGFNTYCLSNTNAIHIAEVRASIDRDYPKLTLDDLFLEVFLSHELQKRKPDAEIFEHVLNSLGIIASETVFIDDSPQHVATAISLGMHGFVQETNASLESFQEFIGGLI